MLFPGGRSSAPSDAGINLGKIEAAILELDTVTDFFNRMVQSCHAKCISTRYADGDLTKGESVCIDRCVYKFHEVQKKVGEKLQSRTAASGGGSGATIG